MSHNPNQQSKLSSTPFRARNFSLLLCFGALAGVLIWAKLRLVTDIPRSAYADPKAVYVLDPDVDALEHQDQGVDSSDSDSESEDYLDSPDDSKPLILIGSTLEEDDRNESQP